MSKEEQIKELKAEVKRLKKLVHHDPLTGALNRRGFIEQASPFFRNTLYAERQKEKRGLFRVPEMSALFIDIDNFKKINDTLGHKEGDSVIKQVVQITKQTVRDSDVVARWGGEEIVVALLGAGREAGMHIAEKIRRAITEEITLKDMPPVTVSIGVAEITPQMQKLLALIDHADKAMYVAKKERGKNAVVSYSQLK